MFDLIDSIYDFNEQAGLLGKPMDTFAETAYVLEEGIEGFEAAFNGQHKDGSMVVPGDKEWVTARSWSLGLMNQVHGAFEQRNLELPSEVSDFDKAIDGAWFNIGRLAKMGLSPDQVRAGFDVVYNANIKKVGAPKDAQGKQLKPEGWVGPEVGLQRILDERVTHESK